MVVKLGKEIFFTYLRLQWQLNLFPFRYKARNFKITVSSALYSRAYKLFCDKSMAANLGASSMKPGAIYLRLGFSLMVRVFRSFSVARLPVAICSRWGHLEIDRNSVRTLVKSSRPVNKIETFSLAANDNHGRGVFEISPFGSENL